MLSGEWVGLLEGRNGSSRGKSSNCPPGSVLSCCDAIKRPIPDAPWQAAHSIHVTSPAPDPKPTSLLHKSPNLSYFVTATAKRSYEGWQ